MSDKPEGARAKPPDKVFFHYLKSNFFRVVFADGAYGGIGPRGMIQFSFFNERTPIPRLASRPLLNADARTATYGQEKMEEARSGYVREVEFEVIMTPQAARELHKWLGDKLDEFEKHSLPPAQSQD